MSQIYSSSNHTPRTNFRHVILRARKTYPTKATHAIAGHRCLFYPQGIVSDSVGNVYISDSRSYIIRKISPAGAIINWAGNILSPGSDDGPLASARFSGAHGLAMDLGGAIYVADTQNHTIRKISIMGVVSTLAGSPGRPGSADGFGSAARFNFPEAIAVDAGGNVFVADSSNHTIRKITPAGMVTTIGGMAGVTGNTNAVGTNALFNYPAGIAVDERGVVYIADGYNNSIRKGVPQGGPVLPTITQSLQNQTVTVGERVTFSVTASGGALTFQWYYNGTEIPGADQSSYTVSSATVDQAGEYKVAVSNLEGTVLGGRAILNVVTADARSRLINISTRSFAGTGSSTQIAGFIISGTTDRKVLIRAGGPYLTQFGVSGALSDPIVTVFAGNVVIASNDDWESESANVTAASTKAGVQPFAARSKDAALVLTLHPGIAYSALISGKGIEPGIALVEVFDVDDGRLSSLSNISTRSFVGTGANIQIAGFILRGGAPRKILIRAGGPYLTPFGVIGALQDPVVTVYQGEVKIAENDDWSTVSAEVDEAQKSLGVTPFGGGSKDSALVLTLNPDQPYTIQVAGKNGSSGVALVEAYALP